MQTMNDKSARLLSGCHPDLQRVVRRAYTLFPADMQIIITCGQRSVEEQQRLVKNGFSKTMRSRHIPDNRGWSHAVDFAIMLGGKLRWDWPPFAIIAKHMKQAAKMEKVPIEWGGDWKTFKDGPHFQLPWRQYPAEGGAAMGLMTVAGEDPSDIIDGHQADAARGVERPGIMNTVWAVVSGGGGAGFLTMFYGLDWRVVVVILAVVTLWGAIGLYLFRDRINELLAGPPPLDGT